MKKSTKARPTASAAPAPLTPPLAIAPSTMPAIFTMPSLAAYLNLPYKTVVRLNFPKVKLGYRTHIITKEVVLARLAEWNAQAGHTPRGNSS